MHIDDSCVQMTSAGVEQLGTLLRSRSAAIQNYGVDHWVEIQFISIKQTSILFNESKIVRFTVGIKLYPTLKNPAADILGQFKVISSVE